MGSPKSRSPKAPSMSLPDALDRALSVYKKEGRHVVPNTVIAQDIGYKNASSGAAISALAALKHYGPSVRRKSWSSHSVARSRRIQIC